MKRKTNHCNFKTI